LPVCMLDPEAEINKRIEETAEMLPHYLSIQFEFEQYYLEGKPSITLQALIEIANRKLKRVAVGTAQGASSEPVDAASFEAQAAKYQWPIIDCSQPIALEPIAIAKPWGQEIWYTGIEKRGQSHVGDGAYSVPLPWFLAVAPMAFTSQNCPTLNLLKILDPLSEPVFGDLYFELHKEKQEVYVVTHVDERAWPNGEGKIKIGFDQAERAKQQTDEKFVEAFNDAVRNYELVRRAIDARLDECRLQEGVALDAPVDADKTKAWLQTIDRDLIDQEFHLREQMDRFKGEISLKVGDVLKVPCFTPHSLMHGVRTIEFQTPVYERQILSFAQKVLTQDHWDTEKASENMSLEGFSLEEFKCVDIGVGATKETIVNFSDFQVERLTLQVGSEVELDSGARYALAIGVKGRIELNGKTLQAEKATFISAGSDTVIARNTSSTASVFLLSKPQ